MVMRVYTLKEYAKKVGYTHYTKSTTLKEIQDYFEEFDSLWDYPLVELEHTINNRINCVIVRTDFGLRLCEI